MSESHRGRMSAITFLYNRNVVPFVLELQIVLGRNLKWSTVKDVLDFKKMSTY